MKGKKCKPAIPIRLCKKHEIEYIKNNYFGYGVVFGTVVATILTLIFI